MLRCDLHIHTRYSRDGESSVEEVLRQAEAVGLDAVAITDHDTVEGALHALQCRTSVIVIPGTEISTKQGHLLALGVTKAFPKGMDFFEAVYRARQAGAVLILPHPYHMWRHGVGLKLRAGPALVDAIEVFNSRYIMGTANRKAAMVARDLGKPAVGGSDAHQARFVGYGYTLVDADRNLDAILKAIRAGKTAAGGRMTPLRSYTTQSLKSSWKKIQARIPK